MHAVLHQEHCFDDEYCFIDFCTMAWQILIYYNYSCVVFFKISKYFLHYNATGSIYTFLPTPLFLHYPGCLCTCRSWTHVSMEQCSLEPELCWQPYLCYLWWASLGQRLDHEQLTKLCSQQRDVSNIVTSSFLISRILPLYSFPRGLVHIQVCLV